MDLFTYLMAKKGHNTHRDLFSYLLGKGSGGGGTYTTYTGASLNISNSIKAQIKNFMLNSTELTQDGTPTPDNPVDVNVIKGDNNIKVTDGTEEQNYPITLSSKNLFNINGDVNTRYNGQTGNYNSVENNKLTATYSTNDGYPYGQRIYVGTGKKVTISGVVSNINSTRSKSALIMCFNDNTTTGVQSVTFDDTEINTRKSFSFTTNTDYIIVAFAGRFSGFISATFTDIQVEYGETATTYMPYIANPLEYCKIGDYADQIFKNTTNSPYYDNTLIENEWYLKKNIGKITFDGSESGWVWSDTTRYAIPIEQAIERNAFCNYFTYANYTTYDNTPSPSFDISTSMTYMGFHDKTITSLNAFKTWLSTHNTKVYYQLATPQYIHISEADYPILRSQLQNLYNNAKSYNGQTNITQTNDGLPFNISVDVKVANL